MGFEILKLWNQINFFFFLKMNQKKLLNVFFFMLMMNMLYLKFFELEPDTNPQDSIRVNWSPNWNQRNLILMIKISNKHKKKMDQTHRSAIKQKRTLEYL